MEAAWSSESIESENPELVRHIRKWALTLSEEEHDLWKQLRRKRDFEDRITEKRAQVTELRDQLQNVNAANTETAVVVGRLNSEVELARMREREMGHDVAVLKESNRILEGVIQVSQFSSKASSQPHAAKSVLGEHERPKVPSMANHDVIAAERAHQESSKLVHEQIDRLRRRVECFLVEKNNEQQRHQDILEKQRTAEQDRNRLLNSLQDDRKSINDMRSERILLHQERSKIEREMAQVVQDTIMSSSSAGGASSLDAQGRSRWTDFAASTGAIVPASVGAPSHGGSVAVLGGVRGPIARDEGSSFGPTVVGGSDGPAGGVGARSHWTGFDSSGGGGTNSGGADFFGSPDRGGYSSSTGTGGFSTSAPPASSGNLPGGREITDWSGSVRDYRS